MNIFRVATFCVPLVAGSGFTENQSDAQIKPMKYPSLDSHDGSSANLDASRNPSTLEIQGADDRSDKRNSDGHDPKSLVVAGGLGDNGDLSESQGVRQSHVVVGDEFNDDANDVNTKHNAKPGTHHIRDNEHSERVDRVEDLLEDPNGGPAKHHVSTVSNVLQDNFDHEDDGVSKDDPALANNRKSNPLDSADAHLRSAELVRVDPLALKKADKVADKQEQRLEEHEVDAFLNLSGDDHPEPPARSSAQIQADEGDGKLSIQVGEKSDPLHDRLSELLAHLYGEGIDAFARDSDETKTPTMIIDCSTEAEDLDWEVNIITTLCPYLREEGPCGQFRHPSYQMEDAKKFCSDECRPHVNALVNALDHRGRLEVHSEATILRGVANGLLLQYAAACRTGTYFNIN